MSVGRDLCQLANEYTQARLHMRATNIALGQLRHLPPCKPMDTCHCERHRHSWWGAELRIRRAERALLEFLEPTERQYEQVTPRKDGAVATGSPFTLEVPK